jgi:two-component sensor histidine kinase
MIEIQGPKITLSSGAVTSMALIFHELATNAAKYGALRESGGRLKVTWDVADGIMKLNWLETGCQPRPTEPDHTGFGSVLLQRSIEGQFGGAMIHVWNSDGLAIAISAPLSRFSERHD